MQHISDIYLKNYLKEFFKILMSKGKIIILEQTRDEAKLLCDIHIHRSEKDYINLFKDAGFDFVYSKKVFRVPSYAMDLWKKYKLPKLVLSFLKVVEKCTLNHKPETIEYVSSVMIFKKTANSQP